MSPFIRTTAGQSNINMEGLRQIPIPLPPLTMQQLFEPMWSAWTGYVNYGKRVEITSLPRLTAFSIVLSPVNILPHGGRGT